MTVSGYLIDRLVRHGTAAGRLRDDLRNPESELGSMDMASAIAFDAADFIWASLVALGCEEVQETREIRNGVAQEIREFLASNVRLRDFLSATAAPAPVSSTGQDGRSIHPVKNTAGATVHIEKPVTATPSACWKDAARIVTAAPGNAVFGELNGVSLEPWNPGPDEAAEWADIHGKHGGLFDEPEFVPTPGKRTAAGVVIEEPDGRVWVVHPTNGYGGLDCTFPKEEATHGDALQSVAIRAAHSKAGLKVAVTGYLGDIERSGSRTRYYHARRAGGNPAGMGWKSQGVSLVPLPELREMLRHPADRMLAEMLLSEKRPARRDIIRNEFGLTSGYRVLAVLNGFRTKFGSWPCRLVIDRGMGAALRDEILTPLGWQMMNDRLETVLTEEPVLLAEGPNGERCDYGNDPCVQQPAGAPGADEWLWGISAANG